MKESTLQNPEACIKLQGMIGLAIQELQLQLKLDTSAHYFSSLCWQQLSTHLPPTHEQSPSLPLQCCVNGSWIIANTSLSQGNTLQWISAERQDHPMPRPFLIMVLCVLKNFQ